MKKLSTNLFLFALLCFIGATNAWADDNPVPSFTEVAKGIYTLDGSDGKQYYSKKVIDLGQKLAIGQSEQFNPVGSTATTAAPTGFTNNSTSRYQASFNGKDVVTLDFTFPKHNTVSNQYFYVITNVPHGLNVNYNGTTETLTNCTVNNALEGSYLCLTYKIGTAEKIAIADATEQCAWYSYDTNSGKLFFDLKSREEYYLYTKAEIYSPISGEIEIGDGKDLKEERYDFIAMKQKTTDAASKTFIQDHKGLFNDRFSMESKNNNTAGIGATGLFFNNDGSKLIVKNLKKGDKITFNHTKGRIQVITAMLSGKYIDNTDSNVKDGTIAANHNLIPGEVYTVESAGDFNAYAKNTIKNTQIEKDKGLTAGNLEISSITITHATSLDPITLNSSGYATRYLTDPVDFSLLPHLKAWIATNCEGGRLTFQEVTKIPAYCGVLLAGDENKTYVPAYASESNDVSSNIFKGVTTAAAPTLEDGKSAFVLSGEFFKALPTKHTNPDTQEEELVYVPANRAYLALSTPTQSETKSLASSYFIPYGEEATGISNVANAPVCKEGFYTLTGIRVAKPAHGVYIFNGKKIFVK